MKSTREGARREGRQRAESGGVECGLVGGTKKLCDVPVLKFWAQCLQNIGICARDTCDEGRGGGLNNAAVSADAWKSLS